MTGLSEWSKSTRTIASALFTSALVFLSLIVTLHFASSSPVKISKPELYSSGHWTQLDELPLRRDIAGSYLVRVQLNPGDRTELKLHVIPDDRLLTLSVNGEPVDLASYDPSDLSDWKSGVIISLDNLTPQANHQVEFGLANSSNPAGLDVRPHHALGLLDLMGAVAGLILLVWALLRHIKLSAVQVGILAAGVAVSVAYLLVTDPRTRTFDVYEGGGHRDIQGAPH